MKSINSVSVVYSTRKIDPVYLESIKSSIGVPNVDIIPIENNHQFSLTKAYNIGLERAKYSHIIFMHDDLKFVTQNWGRKMLNHFSRNKDYGIIGIAGTNNLISGMWWEDRVSMHGVVNHSNGIKTWTSRFSDDQGNKIKQMITLDGLFFCVDKLKIVHKFDEMFNGYHFYDQDFTFHNHLAGVKLGVFTDIRITHMSVGATNDEWVVNKKQFEEKYKLSLPCNLNGVWKAAPVETIETN
jgi:glycosyltransferase involved in cell wall biosynthesis